MKILINYADHKFHQAQKFCTKTAYNKGNFDHVYEYSPKDIPLEFHYKRQNNINENNSRIGKFGLWRPYIVMKTLEMLSEDDFLIYCDSGAFFIRPIDSLIECMNKHNTNVMIFELPFLERQWTKQDVFCYFKAETPEIMNTNQRLSTLFIIRKCIKSNTFVEAYYQTAKHAPFLFTDEDNRLHASVNCSDYLENRHNQSVLSVLSKIHGYTAFRDPSEYGSKPLLYYYLGRGIYNPHFFPECTYKQIIVQHRNNIVTNKTRIGGFLRRHLSPQFYYKIKKIKLIKKINI